MKLFSQEPEPWWQLAIGGVSFVVIVVAALFAPLFLS